MVSVTNCSVLIRCAACKLPTDFLNVDEQNTFGDTWTQMTIGACLGFRRIIRIGSLVNEFVIVADHQVTEVRCILHATSACCRIRKDATSNP